jgi:mannose-6-phosphate isomerase-like protein (cupin superfamily)
VDLPEQTVAKHRNIAARSTRLSNMTGRYGRLLTRFSAAVVLGLLVAAFSAQSRSQAILRAAVDQGKNVLANAGITSPPASSLIVDVAPDTPQAYVLPNLHGEAHDFGGLVLRTLVPNTTSSGALSIVGVNSGQLPLALAHYHEEVEAFYALKGSVETFHNDDQGREVRANDFVLLAPRNVHNYRPIDLDFQLTLCMAPGGIDDFFRSVGEPYTAAGPFNPLH